MSNINKETKKLLKKAMLFCSDPMSNKSLNIINNVEVTKNNICIINLIKSRIYKSRGENTKAQIILLNDFNIYNCRQKAVVLNELYSYDGNKNISLFVTDKCFKNRIDFYVSEMIFAKANNNHELFIDTTGKIIFELMESNHEKEALNIIIKCLCDKENIENIKKTSGFFKILKFLKRILILNEENNCLSRSREEIDEIIKFSSSLKIDAVAAIDNLNKFYVENSISLEYDSYGQLMKDELSEQKNSEESLGYKNQNIINNEIINVQSTKDAFKLLNRLFMNFEGILNNKYVDNALKDELLKEINIIRGKFSETEVKICIVGETGTGKTTFLNTMFNTDLFFTTQEEATGVPTEIRKGEKIQIEVVDKLGAVRSVYEVSNGTYYENNIETLISPEEFILKHTKVNEEALEWVECVRVKLPIEELPKELVIIDTPGFNANIKRTEIAEKAVSQAHVCLFLIDARNALKRKEMEILDIVRNEAGKTFFVLNKMDLIDADDELDCDDEDAADELIERLKKDMRDYFNIKNVMIYPVSSVKNSEGIIDKYYLNISNLKSDVFDEAKAQKLDFIIDMTAKQVIRFSEKMNAIFDNVLRTYKSEQIKLKQALPQDFNVIRDDMVSDIEKQYYELKNQYIEKLKNIIFEHMQMAYDGFYVWLNSVESKSEFKNRCVSVAQKNMSYAVKNIKIERENMMKVLLEEIGYCIEKKIKILYDSLSFEKIFVNEEIIKTAKKLHVNINRDMKEAVLNISNSMEIKGFAGIMGSIIGISLGPIGALCGGVIGAAFFDESLGSMKNQVSDAYDKAWDEGYEYIVKLCVHDLDENNEDGFFRNIVISIHKQIDSYEWTIDKEIKKSILQYKKVKQSILNNKDNQLYIERSIDELIRWRRDRKES